jgi:thermitase
MNNENLSLFPYEREEVFSIQDAKQKAGWNITAFDLPNAWKKSRGYGVKIAVIDTGIDLDHPDLNKNIIPGANIIDPSKMPWDDNQHGTHVAGIVAAENNEIGMVGVAPDAKIIPVKVLDRNGNGTISNVANGIRWAASEGKADLICMSLGAPNHTPEVHEAIKYAASKNVVCFVAAGNSGLTKSVFYPANYPETIAIGSIDESLRRSSFSNTGDNLDFMCPGGKIFSTVPDNWYAVLSGTSMAAPFAAGVAALVLSHARNTDLNLVLNSAEDYRNAFREHTIPITCETFKNNKFYQGFGILEPKKILEAFG